MGYALTAAGYPGRSLGENSIRTTLNLLGNLVLIPILGTVGPAIARLLSVYISNPINVWLLRRSNQRISEGDSPTGIGCLEYYWVTRDR